MKGRQKTDFGSRAPQHHTYLDMEGKRNLSRNDPFFSEGMGGDDYVRVSLASVGQNPDEYKIAGKTWTNYAEALAGLMREESDKKVLEITATEISSEMQSQRIFPLSEEEKHQVISMNPSRTTRTEALGRVSPNSAERLSPNYLGKE